MWSHSLPKVVSEKEGGRIVAEEGLPYFLLLEFSRGCLWLQTGTLALWLLRGA